MNVSFSTTYETDTEYTPTYETTEDMEAHFEQGNETFKPTYKSVIPVGTGEEITEEQLQQAIQDYFASNPTVSKYPDLKEKPKINGVELNGNKTADDLKLQPKGNYLTEEALEDYAKKEEIPSDYVNPDTLKDYALKKELPNVPSWAMQTEKPSYTADEVGADSKGSAAQSLVDSKGYTEQKVSEHNTQLDAHNDIRLFLEELNEKVNHFLDIDDTTKDQASEIVKLIEDNREIIEQITTDKVNVTDIIDNLSTNVSNKPLSAAQGVMLKALIDKIVIPTMLSTFTNDVGYATEAWVEAKKYLTQHQDLSSYAKKSELPTVPTNVSAFQNDAGYLKQHQDLSSYTKAIVADTHVRNFSSTNLSNYCSHGHVEHWSSVNNRNDYKLGDICLLKAQNTSNNNQKVYIFVLVLYPTSTGVQGLSLGYAPVEWS